MEEERARLGDEDMEVLVELSGLACQLTHRGQPLTQVLQQISARLRARPASDDESDEVILSLVAQTALAEAIAIGRIRMARGPGWRPPEAR